MSLIEACQRGDTQVAIALIESGASVNKTDQDRATPLHWACAFGHPAIHCIYTVYIPYTLYIHHIHCICTIYTVYAPYTLYVHHIHCIYIIYTVYKTLYIQCICTIYTLYTPFTPYTIVWSSKWDIVFAILATV